jgi:dihydrofolate reductase
MRISAIAAKSSNNVIGKNNQLPWRLPEDSKYFKRITRRHHVLMGRKTFDSLDKPLPQRTSIILTRGEIVPSEVLPVGTQTTEAVFTVNSLEKGVEIAKQNGENELFVIGGAQIYELAMPILNRLYITEVHTEAEGDTFFPEISSDWKEISREKHFKDEKNIFDYDFVVYER